jgi:signal transduction histidine kinase
MGTDVTVAVGALSHDLLAVPRLLDPARREDAAVLLIACAAALFLVAGAVRLARWRLVQDPHGALAGSALIVMGGLYLPLVGIAAVAGALQHRTLGEAVIRALVSFFTVGLVLRSLYSTRVCAWDRPRVLLPLLGTVVLLAFGVLAAGEAAMPQPVAGGPQGARVLSAAMVLAWAFLAVVVRLRHARTSWSRGSASLFAGLAVAEAAYGQDPGGVIGTSTALLLCTVVAALSVRSANLDLNRALLDTERTIGSLSRDLHDVRGQAVELTEWRTTLVHDAGNAVAGLRAALEVIDQRQARADPPTARLCHAAVEEARHLDHLLHRSPDEPPRAFDVASVAGSIAQVARARGGDVAFRAERAAALGRPGDLVAVLNNLLANAHRHAPGAGVDLAVERDHDVVRIVCWDGGPGLDEHTARHAFERGFRGPVSTGFGIGLHEARALMLAQGGNLVLDPDVPGACFIATLPAASQPLPQVPAQRTGPVSIASADPLREVAR